jgi:DNA-binding transcriptional LysR family regulator
VISYGISNLEGQLGVILFDRAGTRKPKLTEAGRSVLADARTVSHGLEDLRAKVRGLLHGLEPEVHLAVDVMLPSSRLGGVLREFSARYPTVALRLHVEALGAVTGLVIDKRAIIGLSGPLSMGMSGIDSVPAGTVQMIPVAAPAHPLAQLSVVSPGAASRHVQLVLTDRSPLTEGQDFSVLSPRTWRLADLGAKHALLKEGIGWGNMPLPMVEDDLSSNRLVRLNLRDYPGGLYRFSGIWRRDTPPGPAATWLLGRFENLGHDDIAPVGLADI